MTESTIVSVPAAAPIEAAALADMYVGADARVRAELGVEIHDVAGAVVGVVRAVSNTLVNRAVGVRADAVQIDRVVGIFRRAGVARYFVQVDDEDSAAFDAMASDFGLTRYPRAWARLKRVGSSRPEGESDPRIRFAAPADGTSITEILASGFDLPAQAASLFSAMTGRPGWTSFVGCEGGAVVATGFVFRRGAEAYLAAAATLAAARGRGLQTALLRRRIAHALEAGSSVVVSETGEAVEGSPQTSYRNLERAGLRQVARWINYVPSGSA